MVSRLFKKKSEEVNRPSISPEAEVEREKKLARIQLALEEIQAKTTQRYVIVEECFNEVRTLVREKRKEQAKNRLKILKAHQEELLKLENMLLILEKTKIQVTNLRDFDALTEAFRTAAELQEQYRGVNEDLEAVLADKQEMDQNDKELKALIKAISDGSDEDQLEVENMYGELEQEVLDEEARNVQIPLAESVWFKKQMSIRKGGLSSSFSPNQIQGSRLTGIQAAQSQK